MRRDLEKNLQLSFVVSGAIMKAASSLLFFSTTSHVLYSKLALEEKNRWTYATACLHEKETRDVMRKQCRFTYI
jgi:hypothetical protein